MANILTGIYNTLRNATLNAVGVERDLDQLLRDGDISRARGLMQCRDTEVAKALCEYDPETHEVMKRRDKPRKDKEPYRVEKLPRRWQAFINEVALFFLLGRPIKWTNEVKTEDGADNPTQEAFEAYEKFLKDARFNDRMRETKRLAGAETESAQLFRVYRNDAEFTPEVRMIVLAKSKGYTLRPLFDQWGKMLAFGYGYYLKEGSNTIEHFDVETRETTFYCTKRSIGWQVDARPNPTGKINVLYYPQDEEWKGTQRRIERDEAIDSRTADSNNYFADPALVLTANSVHQLPDGAEDVGKVYQLTENAQMRYLEPPAAPEMRAAEKDVLRQSILQDSFTPDFSYENMKGMGTLSGEALRRALILGYMKRENHLETYDAMADRVKNLVLAIMANVTHIHLRDQIAQLEISHEFQSPFAEDSDAKITETANAYTSGICSLETAVSRIGFVGDVKEEVARILKEKAAQSEERMFGMGVSE